MHSIAPKKPVSDYKRTKIVATFGPAIATYEKLLSTIVAGANGIRLNFSHGSHSDHAKAIKLVKKASKESGKPVAVIQDLQGPKIRLGEFEGIYQVAKNQSIRLRYNASFENENILPTQFDISRKVKRGQQVLFFDGKIKTTVTAVKDGVVYLRSENDGYLISKKGINLPDTDLEGDIITTKDRQDILFGIENNIDFVALSFVQSASDVLALKRHLKNLGSTAKVIAKIETRVAVNNLEKIIEVSDGVMIARGDLAIETSVEEVPIIQRAIIRLGIKHAKPTIMATQMLASMIDSPDPTRAEASDIAGAVLSGADAVMLSDETAIGKYPVDAVKVMKKIIRHAETNTHEKTLISFTDEAHTRQTAICKAVIKLSYDINALAIVAETKSGATAYKIAAYRPDLPIIAVTKSEIVARQLALVYGVKAFVRKDKLHQDAHLAEWLFKNNVFKKGDITVVASGKHPGVVGSTDTIKVRIIE